MTNIKLKRDQKLIIPKEYTSEELTYHFVDGVGEFVKKYSLPYRSTRHKLVIDLKQWFGAEVTEGTALIIELQIPCEIDETITTLNPLYDVTLLSKGQQLHVKVTPKSFDQTLTLDHHVWQLDSTSHYQLKLCKMLNETSKYYTEALLLSNADLQGEALKVLDIIEQYPVNQCWKIYAERYDKQGNRAEAPVQLSRFYHALHETFEAAGIDYHEKHNYLKRRIKGLSEQLKVNEVKVDKTALTLHVNQSTPDLNLYLALRQRQGNMFDYQVLATLPLFEGEVVLSDETLNIQQYLKEGDNLDLLVGETEEEAAYVSLAEDVSFTQAKVQLTPHIQGTMYVNGRGALSLYLRSKTKTADDSATRIAVLGTCFSRNALNSSDYFNPQYKRYIDCVYTQFHSTLESCINETEAPAQLLDLYKENPDYQYIETDMKHLFFDQLADKAPDYLIIDLYADAMVRTIELTNGAHITYNYMIKEEQRLGDYVQDWRRDCYKDEQTFMSRWVPILDAFMARLSNIIPLDHVILNRGRLSEQYYDDDGTIRNFGSIDQARRSNYYWEKLDNILLTRYPEVKVLDLTHLPYHSDKNYPFGFSYSHYESKYYQTYFDELIKLLYLAKGI
ncbi:DUF6270 domain-containing protein [Staphylococcus auricularis]|uniref:Uncharacterized protein n=1 Tax=Staphylococcus auricularis TaxID=29379 RepID=A0ABX5IFH1_9STAP|nr:DUF6270 domain-containing protein [Staphylococcus auricularis]MCE5038812.1 hypothetical protein [Staphylococcus auricularis]MEB6570614.1 DUF6270 domain-containing protein [Staphylococcus auricularis]PTH18871.1 hypothetical protein BU607_03410 [Staphylococcus auricularis]PTH27067.1 hypothetical protein BU608_02735 [Staphylococcus auricularis]